MQKRISWLIYNSVDEQFALPKARGEMGLRPRINEGRVYSEPGKSQDAGSGQGKKPEFYINAELSGSELRKFSLLDYSSPPPINLADSKPSDWGFYENVDWD